MKTAVWNDRQDYKFFSRALQNLPGSIECDNIIIGHVHIAAAPSHYHNQW